MPSPNAKKYVLDVMVFALSQVALYYAVKYVLSSLDPMKDKKKEAKAKSEQVLGKLGMKNTKLNEYEEVILSEVIFPDEISISFK
ncbi:12055_t:CDS:2, partial [Funneliformis mosseae]